MLARRDYSSAIAAHIPVPDHIHAAASAVRYDLMHGPAYCRIPQGDVTKFTDDDFATYPEDLDAKDGDTISNAYAGPIGDALRDFIAGLPSSLYIDTQSDCVMESEPEGYQDEETGEWFEPEWSDFVALDSSDIVAALFGRTIAREFR